MNSVQNFLFYIIDLNRTCKLHKYLSSTSSTSSVITIKSTTLTSGVVTWTSPRTSQCTLFSWTEDVKYISVFYPSALCILWSVHKNQFNWTSIAMCTHYIPQLDRRPLVHVCLLSDCVFLSHTSITVFRTSYYTLSVQLNGKRDVQASSWTYCLRWTGQLDWNIHLQTINVLTNKGHRSWWANFCRRAPNALRAPTPEMGSRLSQTQ